MDDNYKQSERSLLNTDNGNAYMADKSLQESEHSSPSENSSNFGMDISESQIKSKGCINSKKERLWCISFSVIFILAVVLVVLLITEYQKKGAISSQKKIEICHSPECVKLSASILSSMNLNVDPCKDFYQYTCGHWEENNPRPSYRSRWGNFDILQIKNNRLIKSLLERKIGALSSFTEKPNSLNPIYKSAKFYSNCLNAEHSREKQAIDSARLRLTDIKQNYASDSSQSASDRTNFAKYLSQIHISGDASPIFMIFVSADDKQSSDNAVHITQSGLSLPDKSYYFPSNNTNIIALRKLISKSQRMIFSNTTESSAELIAQQIIDFESRLASKTIDRSKLRDPLANYHKINISDIKSRWTSFDWDTYFKESFVNTVGYNVEKVLVTVPEYFDQILTLINSEKQSVIINYLVWHRLMSYLDHLSFDYRNLLFQYNRVLRGINAMIPRQQFCVSKTDGAFGFALGNLYVNETFKNESRSKATEMIQDIKTSFKSHLGSLKWMDESTRILAAEKADYIEEKIGYPDFIVDMEQLTTYYKNISVSDQFFADIIAVRSWEMKKNLNDILKKVDRKRWGMSPSTVRLYYSLIKLSF